MRTFYIKRWTGLFVHRMHCEGILGVMEIDLFMKVGGEVVDIYLLMNDRFRLV